MKGVPVTQKFTIGQKVRIIKTQEVGTVVRYEKEWNDLLIILLERESSDPLELCYDEKSLEALTPPESLCGFKPDDRVEIIEHCAVATVNMVRKQQDDQVEWLEIFVVRDDDKTGSSGPWAPSELRKIESTIESDDSPLPAHSGNKYHRRIQCLNQHGTFMIVDVYCVIDAFGVTCPARQHALKKLLCPGKRGKGNTIQDLTEARDAVTRAIELETSRHYQEST